MRSQEFIANRRSKEVHLGSCWWARKIRSSDRILFDSTEISLERIISEKGYDPCGHCLHDFSTSPAPQPANASGPQPETDEIEVPVRVDLHKPAYFNWINRGRPLGDPLTDWLAAEEQAGRAQR